MNYKTHLAWSKFRFLEHMGLQDPLSLIQVSIPGTDVNNKAHLAWS